MGDAPVLVGMCAAIVSIAAFWLAAQAARAQAYAGVHAVDAEAYTRAAAIYEDTIANLRTDITSLRVDLADCRTEIRDLRVANEVLTAEIRVMRGSA